MRNIAVLIPCYNEEKTVAGVVKDFRAQLPDAAIYVYDNNSIDRTAEEAARAGAIVRRETRQGKGNVMQSMFRQIEADIYVMVDGDGTYPADRVHDLIAPIEVGEADMVNGSRLHSLSTSSFKGLNLLGNKMFLFLLNTIFKVRLTDLLSGYRAFNRDLVKNLPLLSRGFDIETELTLKAIERNYRIIEVPVNLSTRPEGSESKIRIFRDGILIFNTIFALLRDYKPLTAFGSIGMFFIVLGFIPGFIVIREFILTRYISHVPSAILAVGLVVFGTIIAFIGLVLHAISRRFQEVDCQIQGLASLLGSVSREKDPPSPK